MGKSRREIDNIADFALKFGFWMRYGSNDIFSVICYGVIRDFRRYCFQIGMVSMDGMDGSAIASTLDATIHSFGIEDKTIACVYDEGANLRK